ncbi:MAG: acyl-CoA dehydrogenase family protein [Acidimicrobiales bacterium]|nr:acyl-CoA dehydrogenase family protein [Acidimicrobiales bacterium]
MDFDLTPEQTEWREAVRSFLSRHLTPELRDELLALGFSHSPLVQQFQKEVADQGWWGVNWPVEYGGLDKTAMEQLILIDELEYAGAPSLPLTVTSLGPMIIRFGTEENKRDWLPLVTRGEATFALGYSEPDAGTDLASLRTKAELDGDEWIINGQKIWNSEAHLATHEWLAVRTDPDAPKHRGISVIIVPIDSPGITIQPLWTWGDVRTNQVYFEDVRVPKGNLIGEVNQGWYYIVGALAFERMALGTTGSLRRLFDDLVDFCGRTMFDGQTLSERPEVQLRLAELAVDLEVSQLFSLQTATLMDAGGIPAKEASMQKVFTTELRTKLADWGTQIVDLYGQLHQSDEDAALSGRLERAYRMAPFLRFGGGTNEVMRSIIAERGLGLPRST